MGPDNLNELIDCIWNEESEQRLNEEFDHIIDVFLGHIASAKTIGLILTTDTIAYTWHMMESLLVMTQFKGTLYIQYSKKDSFNYIPFVDPNVPTADYCAYHTFFHMVFVDDFSKAPELDFLFSGAGQPACLPESTGNRPHFYLSVSHNFQDSFFITPYDTEEGRQDIFFYLKQFNGHQHAESLPFYCISPLLNEQMDPAIREYYCQHIPAAYQEFDTITRWMDELPANCIPMVVEDLQTLEDALLFLPAIASFGICTLIPLFTTNDNIFRQWNEIAENSIQKEGMKIYLEGAGIADCMPRLYKNADEYTCVLQEVQYKIEFTVPKTPERNKVYIFPLRRWPWRLLDYLFYHAGGLSLPDETVYPSACHRPVLFSTHKWNMPQYEFCEPANEDTGIFRQIYDDVRCALNCPEGYRNAWQILYGFMKQADDKQSGLWLFLNSRTELYALKYYNKLFHLAGILYTFMSKQEEKPALLPLQVSAASPFTAFYQAFTAQIQAHHQINFAAYPELSALAVFLQNTTGSAIVTADSPDTVIYEKNNCDADHGIWGITIQDASFMINGHIFKGPITIYASWDDSTFDADIHVSSDTLFSPPGLPWLAMEQVTLEAFVSGQSQMADAFLNGTLPDTGLTLQLQVEPPTNCCTFKGRFSKGITALEPFYALTGGVDFLSQMPAPLQSLGQLALQSFTINYCPSRSKVLSFSLGFGLEQAWIILKQPLISVNPAIFLDIYHPADFSNRSFHVTLSGDCVIGEGNGVLRMEGGYPPLILRMDLRDGDTYSIKKLLLDFGIDDFDYDLKINMLHVTAMPMAGNYQFAVALGDVLSLGKFTVDSLGLYLNKTKSGLSAAFAGSMEICGVGCRALIDYSSADGWMLSAGVSFGTAGATAKDLITAYGDMRLAAVNDDVPNPLAVQADLSYAVKTGYWEISAAINHWELPFAKDLTLSACLAMGSGPEGFYCGLEGGCSWNHIDLSIGYSYLAGGNCFTLRWNSLEGRIFYSDTECYADLCLSNTTLGAMVETMVEWVTGTAYGLSEPWGKLLNNISLNCSLRYDFLHETVDLTLQIPAFDLGFAKIDGITLAYKKGENGKYGAFITLAGEFPWIEGNGCPQWDAARPETTPAPNGKGNAYFDLRLLALGHRVELFGQKPPQTVEETVTALRQLTPDIQPTYTDTVEWIVAADFGLLRQDDGKYLADVQLVFYDPLLYAMRICMGGVLDGLIFNILYTKINDSLGVFRGSITLPERIRRLTLGIYTLVLPEFSADIYTDGSFRFDFGFPAGGDFSRALSFEGMAGPIPVTGAAGIYIGRFTGGAGADYVPKTSKGIFNPITAFGFGVKFGIGKSIDAGILKAGFSLTMTAVLEGVYARFSPYVGKTADYYRASGMISIEGGLYGMIDFAVLSASVSAAISLTAAFTFEAYRACEIQVHAEIAVCASLEIHLWLFTITISFQFHADVSASFTIGSDQIAPWDSGNRILAVQAPAIAAAALDYTNLKPTPQPYVCSIHISLPLSVTDCPSRQVSAALLLTISVDDFTQLVKLLLAWLLAAAVGPATLEEIMAYCPQKAEIDAADAALNHDRTMPYEDLDLFMQHFVHMQAVTEQALKRTAQQVNGVYFPFPPKTQVGGHALSESGMLSSETLDQMKEIFSKLALSMEDSEKTAYHRNACEISAAQWLFQDYFTVLARQALKGLNSGADGKTPLSILLETVDYAGIGGMVSRFNLHGLRIPLADGSEQPALTLAGTLFQGVLAESSYTIVSNDAWLKLPAPYTATPDPQSYAMLADFLAHGTFTPQYELLPETPSSAPVTVSFFTPYMLGEREVWKIPAALPRGGERYTLHFEPAGEGQAALTLPLTVRKTAAVYVYTICAGQADSIDALADLVRKNHPVVCTELYYTADGKSEGNYQKADTGCIAAARLDQSVETHPPIDQINAANNEKAKKHLQISYHRLATLLFEALVANNNGYVLIAPADLPDTAFDTKGQTVLQLLFLFDKNVPVTEAACSAVVLQEPVHDSARDLFLSATAEQSRYHYALTSESNSVVNMECKVQRVFPQDGSAQAFVENQYSILRYRAAIDGAAADNAYSAPVSFTEDGLYRFALPADLLTGGGDYTAIGHTVCAHCQWLDLFGNQFGQGFTASVLCGYKDSLVPLSAWPYLHLYYTIEGHMAVLYALPADRETIPADSISHVQTEYARIIRQLQDPNGVTTTFVCPVLGIQGAVPLVEWAKTAVDYFQNGGTKPTLCHSLPIKRSTGKSKELELRPVCASIQIQRAGNPQKGFEQVANVKSVCTQIPASENTAAFAKAYEAAVCGVRLVNSQNRLYEIPDITQEIRLGQAHIFAPAPFSNTLYSGTSHAYYYEPGTGLTKSAAAYTGADVGRMAADALACIDDVFSADIAGAAVLSGYAIQPLENSKKNLAKLLSLRLLPLEKGIKEQPSAAVSEAFYQLMLSKLSNYFAVRGMISIDADVGLTRNHARFYGSIQGNTQTDSLAFSTAKIELKDGKNELVIAVKGPETIFDRQGAALSYADIDLQYNITHIEDAITEIIDGYVSSEWLSSASGGALATPAADTVRLPLPALYFPEVPVFTKQQFTMDADFTARYCVGYEKARRQPQVEDCVTVFYDPQERQSQNASSLMDALAGFHHAGKEILQDLHNTAQKLLSAYPQTDAYKTEFSMAMDAMVTLCQDLERALQTSVQEQHNHKSGRMVSFRVTEGAENGCYTMTVSQDGVTPHIAGYTSECTAQNTYVFKKDDCYLTPVEGQAILERTFLLPREKILSVQAATAELYSEINSRLADTFVMKTDTIAAGSTAHAHYTVEDTIDLHTKYQEPDIQKAFKIFLQDIGGDLEVSAECRRIDQDGIEFPLFMQLPARNNPDALAAAWTHKIDMWLDTVPKPLKKDTQFTFHLNLCFGDVLKIPHVTVYWRDENA